MKGKRLEPLEGSSLDLDLLIWRHHGASTTLALVIAVRLRKETTLSVKQIAARLHLGTPGQRERLLAGGAEENNRRHASPKLAWNLKKDAE